MDFARRARQSTCFSSFTDCKNSDELGKFPCTCASLPSRKRMSPSTESCCGLCSHGSVYQRICSPLSASFHEGMQARVRTDDGEYSEYFDVTQGLRQGCELSPLLFNIFFAAVIHAVLVRFSEDPEIVRDLIHLEEHLEEDGAGVNADLQTRVRRAV